MRKSEKHRKLMERGMELLDVFDSIERLDEEGDSVPDIRRRMRTVCMAKGPSSPNALMGLAFDNYHDDCDYCALIFAYRRRLKKL